MIEDKEYIPYKESEDLKELGFDEPCFRVLHDETEICRPLYDEGEESLYNSMYDDSRFVVNPHYTNKHLDGLGKNKE